MPGQRTATGGQTLRGGNLEGKRELTAFWPHLLKACRGSRGHMYGGNHMFYKNRRNGIGEIRRCISHTVKEHCRENCPDKKAAANSSARTRVMKINTAYQLMKDISEHVETLTETNEDHYLPWALLFSVGQEPCK